jgi:hypothetical protein
MVVIFQLFPRVGLVEGSMIVAQKNSPFYGCCLRQDVGSVPHSFDDCAQAALTSAKPQASKRSRTFVSVSIDL